MDSHHNRQNAVDRNTATDAVETPADADSSSSVGWQDISDDTEIAVRTDSERGRPATASRDSDVVENTVDGSGITDRIRAGSGEPLTIETGAVTATLVGVPRVRIDDLVYAHHRKRIREHTRACALFDIENTSTEPIRWTSRRTKFIGTDGYTYRQAHVSLAPSELGPGCHPSGVEIDPGRRRCERRPHCRPPWPARNPTTHVPAVTPRRADDL